MSIFSRKSASRSFGGGSSGLNIDLGQQISVACERGELEQAVGLMRQANLPTRTHVWLSLGKTERLNNTLVDALMLSATQKEDPDLKCWLLHFALQRGATQSALHMIEINAPLYRNYSLPHSKLEADPMPSLMYDNYPNLPENDRLIVAQAMFQKGDLTRFNPGMIKRLDILQAFVDHAPHPLDKDKWGEFIWDPSTFARDQCLTETDPRNAAFLLERGFPGIAIDLVVRALGRGYQDCALALIDWAGDAFPVKGCENIKSAMDTITEQPVTAHGFWHALVDQWASGISAAKNNGWQKEELAQTWPRPDVLERLLRFDELDTTIVDEDGVSALQLSIDICGEPGPMALVESQRQALRLDQQTPDMSKTAPRPRL